MAKAANGRLVIDDLRGGRNGRDPAWALKDTECVDAVNVDYYKARLGNKRGGMVEPTTTGSTTTGRISSIFRHVPGTSEADAELWKVDDAATPIMNRLAGGTAWSAPTLKDAPTGNGWDVTAASINGKLFLAYKSAQGRLHVWDGSTVRRAGLAMPAVPSAANTGSTSSIAVDATATLDYGATLTFSHTCAASAKILWVLVRADTDTVSAVTYNSVAMTQVAAVVSTGNYYLFYLVNPSSGAHTVAITTTSNAGAASVSYTGGATSGIPDAFTTGSSGSTSLSTTVTTIADRCWAVCGVADRSGVSPTASTNSTARATPNAATSMTLFDSNAQITPAGPFTMTAGVSAASGAISIMASFPNAAAAYSAVLRYYRVRWTRQIAGITIGRSEPSSSVSFTPSGSGTAARITQPSVANEGETHWEVEASLDDMTFYRIATVAIGTTTYDDSIATTSYADYPLSDLTGVYTLQKSYKFIAADQNRLLGFGSYTTTDKQSRIEISAVIGSSDIGDEERVDTSAVNSYIDLDESDSGVATGLAGPVFGAYFAFKDRQVWKLTPTGVTSGPYKQDAITKSIGAVHHYAIAKGEDRDGNTALYWMSHRGPYRWTVDGLEYLGSGIEDYILGPTATINLSATTSIARMVYYSDKRQIWLWFATGSANDCNQGFIYDVAGGGWSRIPTGDALANVRCAVLFSNTLGASMSRDLKPYVGQTGAVSRLWKCDTGTDDNGTAFQAYVDTKHYEPGGPGIQSGVGDGQLMAKAATGVAISITTTTDFGFKSAMTTTTLTAKGSESRVVLKVTNSCAKGGGAGPDGGSRFVQYRIGDAGAVSNTWTLDRFVVPYTQTAPDTQ